MNSALVYGTITMLAWGVWIVLGDAASDSIAPEMAAFVTYFVATILVGVYVLVTDVSVAVTGRGLALSALAGVGAVTGVVATYIGVSIGSTALVSTLGGMYFVITAIISVLALGEPLSANKVVGIGLALAAIVVINQ
ncbi:DMT family transporter [Halogeometricum luteum]|uniref:DMT family transporter n=1 Tax=Halogeometricum luteum TaxID=2950537 RepID=A0ABU2G2J9_9EURY|nr:DMT family transporter [Halogeometricum sp. S3BR5-2]MDS0295006.1 DMT family transporter [Halogeometricum sp. S3BR5-2]